MSKINNDSKTVKDNFESVLDGSEDSIVMELPIETDYGSTARNLLASFNRWILDKDDNADIQTEVSEDETVTTKYIRIYNEDGEFFLAIQEDTGSFFGDAVYITLTDGSWGGLRYGAEIKNFIEELQKLTTDTVPNNSEVFCKAMGIEGEMEKKFNEINDAWDDEGGMSISKVSKILKKK